MAKREDNGESVFQIIRRLVQPIEVIAEMLKTGDADQARLDSLIRLLLASLVELGESINQSQLDADEAAHTDEFLQVVSHIIVGLRDWLQASATAIYDRESNSRAFDEFSDKQSAAIFISRNILPYAANHEPTVREWQDNVNLAIVEMAAANQKPTRVRALIAALQRGLE